VGSVGFPLQAGETEPLGFPSRSGGNLQEGGKNRIFRTPSGVGRGCSKNGCSCVVFDKGIHQPPLFGAPKRLFAGRIPPLPHPLPPCSRGERAGVRGDSSSPRCFGIFGSTRCTLIRPNGGKNRPHFRTPSANPLTNAPEMGYNRVMNFAPTPLPQRGKRDGEWGGCSKQESSARRRKHKIGEAEANSPHPNPLPPSSRGEREEGSGGINTKTGGDARWQGYDAPSTGRSRTPNRCSGVPSARRGTAETIPPSAFGTTNAAAPKSTKSPKGRNRLPSPLQARRYSDAKRESSDEGL
jgi:hypothetical protein